MLYLRGAETVKRTLTPIIFTVIMLLFLNIAVVEPGTYAPLPLSGNEDFSRMSALLADANKSDLAFCLTHIKRSKESNADIANFIITWSPEAYKRKIPSMFRSKIDRVVSKLQKIDYQKLVIDVDLIKNSQLTVSDMVKIIKGTRLYSKN